MSWNQRRNRGAIAPTRGSRREPLGSVALALALGVLVAAPAARADTLAVEAIGGWQNLQPSTTSVGNAIAGREGTAILGGDVLVGLGGLGLGLGVDKTVSGSARPWAGSLMAGFLIPLPLGVRVDALGEMGRRAPAFDDLFHSGSTFLGLRPGVSFPVGTSPVRLGLTGLARWPTSGGSLGSPDYAILGRVSFE
jgi:hypothetical protein